MARHSIALFALAAAGLSGCPAEDAEGPSDRERYQDSATLSATDPAAAAAMCVDIGDMALRGECTVFAVRALGKIKGDTDAVCATLQGAADPWWHELCVFEAVDASGRSGDEAISRCAHSGQFLERCLAHALGREASRELRASYPPGTEADFMAWAQQRMEHYGLVGLTRQPLAQEYTARALADRARDASPPGSWVPWSLARCGGLPEPVCEEGYRKYLRMARGPRDGASICGGDLTAETVAAAGLPAWEPDVEGLALGVWGKLCKTGR